MSVLPKSPAKWKLPKRYEVEQIRGSGAFGTVCQAYDHHSKRLVAITRVGCLFDNQENAKKTLRELKILTACDHDSVIRLYDAFIPQRKSCFTELYMIMEICDSDMRKLIQMDCRLEQGHIQILLYNLLLGMKYLHSAGIYHRDLKPENLLVNQDCSVKICDFNLACTAPLLESSATSEVDVGGPEPARRPMVPSTLRAQRQLTKLVVTRWYRAPEVILLQSLYTEAIDVWSIGCILAELLETLEGGPSHDDRGALFPGSTAYPADTRATRRGHDQLILIIDMLGTPKDEEIRQLDCEGADTYVRSLPYRVGRGLRNRYPWAKDEEMDLLENMLRFDPSRRITVDEALEKDFVRAARAPGKEVVAPARIRLDFEDNGEDLDLASLRRHFCDHVKNMRDVALEGAPEASIAGA